MKVVKCVCESLKVYSILIIMICCCCCCCWLCGSVSRHEGRGQSSMYRPVMSRTQTVDITSSSSSPLRHSGRHSSHGDEPSSTYFPSHDRQRRPESTHSVLLPPASALYASSMSINQSIKTHLYNSEVSCEPIRSIYQYMYQQSKFFLLYICKLRTGFTKK